MEDAAEDAKVEVAAAMNQNLVEQERRRAAREQQRVRNAAQGHASKLRKLLDKSISNHLERINQLEEVSAVLEESIDGVVKWHKQQGDDAPDGIDDKIDNFMSQLKKLARSQAQLATDEKVFRSCKDLAHIEAFQEKPDFFSLFEKAMQATKEEKVFDSALKMHNARTTQFSHKVWRQCHPGELRAGEEDEDLVEMDDEEELLVSICPITKAPMARPQRNDKARGGCGHVYSADGVEMLFTRRSYAMCPISGCGGQIRRAALVADKAMAKALQKKAKEDEEEESEEEIGLDLTQVSKKRGRRGKANSGAAAAPKRRRS